MGVVVGVGVDVVIIFRKIGIFNVFAGTTVGVTVTVGVDVAVTAGEIFELSVAVMVGSKVTVGVTLV